MKLTAAIAMSYPNAHVTLNGYDVPIFKIDEIDFKHGEFTLMRVSDGDIFHEPIYKCQLILTPLDKISDEDAVEVAKIIENRTNVDWTGSGKDSIITFLHTAILGHESQFEGDDSDALLSGCMVEIICYCQAHSIDIGHGSIPSLISAGIAVEK